MRLFDGDPSNGNSSNQSGAKFNQIHLPSSSSTNWGSTADTLRPGSINIPDFDHGDRLGAFEPAATPWYMASATSVSGGFGQSDSDGDIYSRFGMAIHDEPEEESGQIQVPTDYPGSGTIRPGFSSGVNDFDPNPFPKRGRQFSSDSNSSFSPFGGFSSGPSFNSSAPGGFQAPSEVAESDEWDFPAAGTSESATAHGRVAQSPSLPTLATRHDESPTAVRSHASPRSLASRLRSNTAPNFDSSLGASPPTEAPGKNVLNFAGRHASPFANQRPHNGRRPTALHLVENGSQARLGAPEVSPFDRAHTV